MILPSSSAKTLSLAAFLPDPCFLSLRSTPLEYLDSFKQFMLLMQAAGRPSGRSHTERTVSTASLYTLECPASIKGVSAPKAGDSARKPADPHVTEVTFMLWDDMHRFAIRFSSQAKLTGFRDGSLT